MITRRKLLVGFGSSTFLSLPLLAQQGKVFRIGVLESTPIEGNVNFEVFRRTLHELGYQKSLAFEYRSSYGRNERFTELAAELVRLKVDLILTRGTPASQAAKAATRTIPIVTAAASDPVRTGLAESLARPGGNFTGMEPFAVALWAKRAELLKELLPSITRLGDMNTPTNVTTPLFRKEWDTAARSIGLETLPLDVRTADDFAPAFQAAAKQRVGAIVIGIDGLMTANLRMIVELAAKHRMPTIYMSREFVDAGGLISYAVDYRHLYARAAIYADKMLKGARPSDLPIEQPTKFELVINMKAAKALGITIPPSVRLRADEVIE